MNGKNRVLGECVLVLLIFFSAGTVLQAEGPSSQKKEIRVIVNEANIRLKPSLDSTVISNAPLGTVLTYQAKEGDWYRIELPEKERGFTIIGYIHHSIVEVIGGAAEPQPAEKEAVREIEEENTLRVITVSAEVRNEPDAESDVIVRAPAGSMLFSTKRKGDWYKVELKSGKSGYVHADQTEVVMEELETPEEPEEAKEEKQEEEEIPEPAERPRGREIPPPPPPEEEPMRPPRSGKLYLKGFVGFGAGFDKIFTGYVETGSGDDDDVNIYPGGGVNIEVLLGYRLMRNLMVEMGIGYQSSGETAGDDSVKFSRFPVKMTLIYEFPSSRSFQLYTGAGAGAYLGPAYKEDVGSSKAKITYGGAFGIHALLGLAFHRSSMSYFVEVKYEGLMNYSWKTATQNGHSGTPTSRFAEMSGNGVFFNFGVGFRF